VDVCRCVSVELVALSAAKAQRDAYRFCPCVRFILHSIMKALGYQAMKCLVDAASTQQVMRSREGVQPGAKHSRLLVASTSVRSSSNTVSCVSTALWVCLISALVHDGRASTLKAELRCTLFAARRLAPRVRDLGGQTCQRRGCSQLAGTAGGRGHAPTQHRAGFGSHRVESFAHGVIFRVDAETTSVSP
jgi:hypothetical protein